MTVRLTQQEAGFLAIGFKTAVDSTDPCGDGSRRYATHRPHAQEATERFGESIAAEYPKTVAQYHVQDMRKVGSIKTLAAKGRAALQHVARTAEQLPSIDRRAALLRDTCDRIVGVGPPLQVAGGHSSTWVTYIFLLTGMGLQLAFFFVGGGRERRPSTTGIDDLPPSCLLKCQLIHRAAIRLECRILSGTDKSPGLAVGDVHVDVTGPCGRHQRTRVQVDVLEPSAVSRTRIGGYVAAAPITGETTGFVPLDSSSPTPATSRIVEASCARVETFPLRESS